MTRKIFLEGPAGVGKTTYAIGYTRDLLRAGARPESILLLVPQRTVSRPYQAAFAGADWPGGAQIDIVTLGGLARRSIETFWPLIAEKAGFSHPEYEPTFLTIETAQYYISGLVNAAVETGVFDSISMPRFRIMSQLLDNLSKAAVNGFLMDSVADRLAAAWGSGDHRHSSRVLVYQAGQDIMARFRAQCLENSFLDFSLQMEVFINYLLKEPLYRDHLFKQYQHLLVDNLEESFPIMADFIHSVWESIESALLIYDTDAGYRVFLGADPESMYALRDMCDEVQQWRDPVQTTPALSALVLEFSKLFRVSSEDRSLEAVDPRAGFTYSFHRFYPQMIDWVTAHIVELVDTGVPPQEIVILVPFLGDSLRFALTTRLTDYSIPIVSHRPSRTLRDEPSARAILTLMALAHPAWGYHPPAADVASALEQAIDGLDPVRAWLLAQIVYHPGREKLGAFDSIQADAQSRITFWVGEKYEKLRQWLGEYQESEAGAIPPDHFLSRLFGEVLSQPGFGFHTDLDAGRVIAELVESARKFRRTRHPAGTDLWLDTGREYFSLVQEGLVSALYVPSWRDEQAEAVFLGPAYTFVMRNRWVDYQFWLDVGSSNWWERLEQPLTHPYVLSRSYPAFQVWTDEMEFSARYEMLSRLVIGLTRRCRQHIFAAVSDLSDQGYEQRGPLLQVFQQIAQRYGQTEGAET